MGSAGSNEPYLGLRAIAQESERCFTEVIEFYSIKKHSS